MHKEGCSSSVEEDLYNSLQAVRTEHFAQYIRLQDVVNLFNNRTDEEQLQQFKLLSRRQIQEDTDNVKASLIDEVGGDDIFNPEEGNPDVCETLDWVQAELVPVLSMETFNRLENDVYTVLYDPLSEEIADMEDEARAEGVGDGNDAASEPQVAQPLAEVDAPPHQINVQDAFPLAYVVSRGVLNYRNVVPINVGAPNRRCSACGALLFLVNCYVEQQHLTCAARTGWEHLNPFIVMSFFNLIIEKVFNVMAADTTLDEDHLFYLCGVGGCDKTFFYWALCQHLRRNAKQFKCASWTGISALLLPEGSTCHYTFGLPIKITSTSTSTVEFHSNKASALREAHVLINDEISMFQKEAFHIVDEILQAIMNNNKPFGGKLLIVSGDFKQLLPVISNFSANATALYSPCYSPLRRLFKMHKLVHNRRATIDSAYEANIAEIGRGAHARLPGYIPQAIRFQDELLVATEDIVGAVFSDDILATEDDRQECRCYTLFIPRLNMDCETSESPCPFSRYQFPVRIGFAMTINKSQGQTLSKVGLFLPRATFSHGNLYTGVSSVASYDDLFVFI
ncbi:hypothetical protein B566_EDAN013323 [Ephemera danica]|nr:hypothetical protein B566_EDAN013323 [Ephemera danica]